MGSCYVVRDESMRMSMKKTSEPDISQVEHAVDVYMMNNEK